MCLYCFYAPTFRVDFFLLPKVSGTIRSNGRQQTGKSHISTISNALGDLKPLSLSLSHSLSLPLSISLFLSLCLSLSPGKASEDGLFEVGLKRYTAAP